MIFSLFRRLKFDTFWGNDSGSFLARFWDGFWSLWEVRNAKKWRKRVTVVVMVRWRWWRLEREGKGSEKDETGTSGPGGEVHRALRGGLPWNAPPLVWCV